MSTGRYKAAMKTRVETHVKRAFQQLAKQRDLEVADIVREAFREYLAKNDPSQLELAGTNGRKAA